MTPEQIAEGRKRWNAFVVTLASEPRDAWHEWLVENGADLLTGAESAATLHAQVVDLREQLDDLATDMSQGIEETFETDQQQLQEIATLQARIVEIADEAIELQAPGTDPIAMLDALEKRFHEWRILALNAESERDGLRIEVATLQARAEKAEAGITAVWSTLTGWDPIRLSNGSHEDAINPIAAVKHWAAKAKSECERLKAELGAALQRARGLDADLKSERDTRGRPFWRGK
jgi:DNA repair exonuclease SbcCD ATPase subunit